MDNDFEPVDFNRNTPYTLLSLYMYLDYQIPKTLKELPKLILT